MEITKRVKHHPEQIAIREGDKLYSYTQLLNKAKLIAHALLADKKDLLEERICFLITPGFDYAATQWGIWLAGGVAVPLCTLHPESELEYVIKDCKPILLIADEFYKNKLYPLAKNHKIEYRSIHDFPISSIKESLPDIDTSRAAMILYTSGTTSAPKGVVSTHSNLEFQIQSLVKAWAWNQDDQILNVLPLHHVHGIINVMSCALWSGACCHFLSKFDAKTAFDIFIKGEVNVFMAVPTIYYKLIKYFDACDDALQERISVALNKFRLMVSGSAALPIPTLEKWQKISGHTLLERYGMTEIGMAISNPYEGERRAGHIGKALESVSIRLVNEQGLVTEESVAGEIQIKGPNVFKEYWKNPSATQKAFTDDGWFKSGDIAELNDGYYRIMGRDSIDIIKSGGYKISALEIEDRIRSFDGIEDCAVVGLNDPEWGEKIVCFYIANKLISYEALKIFLKELLPPYKIPKEIFKLDHLPRNTLGKVTKNKLKDIR